MKILSIPLLAHDASVCILEDGKSLPKLPLKIKN